MRVNRVDFWQHRKRVPAYLFLSCFGRFRRSDLKIVRLEVNPTVLCDTETYSAEHTGELKTHARTLKCDCFWKSLPTVNQSPGTHLKKRKRKKRHLEQQSGSVSTGSMCAWVCMYSMCVRLFMCTSVCVCVCVFCCVLLSSRQYEFTFSQEWESGKPCWCVCLSVCVCVSVHLLWEVYVCGERKGCRLYVCECVSFFSSLSECLFLDRFEGQGLATGGEKLCSHLKGKGKEKKESSRSLHNEKKTENTTSS